MRCNSLHDRRMPGGLNDCICLTEVFQIPIIIDTILCKEDRMMKRFRMIVALMLVLFMGMNAVAAAAETIYYQKGDQIEDFTVTTCDGKTFTLSEVLKEKEMVLINIWATWCGPCRREFPYMEQAYEQYADKVEIIALSCEPTDTDDVLTEFAAEMGLTFCLSQDTTEFAAKFGVTSIPTSIVVDRFGTICFIEAGSMPDADSFARLFDAFLGEDYTESVLLDGVPARLPDAEASPAEELSAALNAEGAQLVFEGADDVNAWPMVVCEKDDRLVAASSNTWVDGSYAALSTKVNAKAGDAVVVTFKTSTEAAFDLFTISINQAAVKSFSGEHDWMTYAWPVEADGEYTVELVYRKDVMSGDGDDCVWVDCVAVVSGEEAEAALAANPVYPTASENALLMTTEGGREIVFDDPNGFLNVYFGDFKAYIIGSETADFLATITADIDPETAFFYCNYDGATVSLTQAMTKNGYQVQGGVDNLETTGYEYTSMFLYADMDSDPVLVALYFLDELNVNSFVMNNLVDANGVALCSWMYADGTLPATNDTEDSAAAVGYESTYTVRYVDQDGSPVAGVMCQVCDESTCQVFVSDAEGVCAFTLAPYAWEIHTLRVPDGYTGDTETVTIAPVEGGELVFILTKN